jgi:hypothetical protein
VPRDQLVDRIAPRCWNDSRRFNQASPPIRSGDEMDPGVRLGKTFGAIKNKERQRIVRIIAVLRQQRPTKLALHGNEEKRRLDLVTLEPASAAATEIAQAVEDHYSFAGVMDSNGSPHCPTGREYDAAIRHLPSTTLHTRKYVISNDTCLPETASSYST